MRIVFMGTPDFSVPCLEALARAGHEIVAVYSQPPRKSGRGHKIQPSPVQAFAEDQGWETRHPTSLKFEEEQKAFIDLNADLAVVVAYGLILPKAILEAPKKGCVNVHASLLPRWRGAAPIQRAIEAGDEKSGVCIMQMDEGLDKGDVISRSEVDLTAETTGQALHDELSKLGADLLVKTIAAGFWEAKPQPEEGATYAKKLEKAEGLLDFNQPAVVLERKIRAFFPWPGTSTKLDEKILKVLKASVLEGQGQPAVAMSDDLVISCGEGALKLDRIQLQGKGPMSAADFLRGHPVPKGTVLGQK